MWRNAEMAEDVIHGNADGGGGVEHVVTIPKLQSDGGNGPAFATAGQGVIRLWDEEGRGLAALRSPPGTSPCAVVAAKISQGNDASTLLAAAFKITHRSDPNQFRLVPQDEAGRQRRVVAEEQERQLQQQLAMSASRVHVFVRRGNQISQMEIGPTNQGGPLLPITCLATLPTNDGGVTLVLGDGSGRIRLNRFISGINNAVDRDEYLNLQLRSTDRSVLSIVCIEPLSESLIAVSSGQTRGEVHHEQSPSNAIELSLPVAQAVHIIDLATCTCKATLNGHKDVVHAICLLPDGCLATCGGKMDAKTRVWDLSKLQDEMNGYDVSTEADSRELEEVGYVFGLAVLPDTKPDSQHYALAAARYNVVRICI
jgi:WD40 repeat protein